MEISALYFIGFKMIVWDNMIETNMSNVAYGAHLSGYAFGIAAMLVMLSTGLISHSSFDLWAMIKQWNRRRVYRDVVARGYDPFTGQTKSKKITQASCSRLPYVSGRSRSHATCAAGPRL